MSEYVTVNTTFKIRKKDLTNVENEFYSIFDVVDFKILPDTEWLYKNDKTFKKLVDRHRKDKRIREVYINDHNHR